jgi:RecJ-like exonuclease
MSQTEWTKRECEFCNGKGYVNTTKYCEICLGHGVIFTLTIKSE